MQPQVYNNSNSPLKAIYRYRFIILGTVLLCLFGYLASQYSFININVTTNSNEPLEYSLISSNAESKTTNTSKQKRFIVKRGSYQVAVVQSGKSLVANAEANGFLRTTNISGDLLAESRRTFIGEKPAQCLFSSSGEKLVSWSCGSVLRTAISHVPATNVSPGYNTPITATTGPIQIQGIIKLPSKSWVFVRLTGEYGLRHGFYELNETNGTINTLQFTPLDSLDPARQYGITNYGTGFLVYEYEGGEFLSFTDIGAAPQRVVINKTKSEEISFYGITTHGEKILVLNNRHYNPEYLGYSRISQGASVISPEYFEKEDEGIAKDLTPVNYSELVVAQNGTEKRFSLDYAATQARLCGDGLICVLRDTVLNVYREEGDDLAMTYSVPGVIQIESNGKNILLVTKQGTVDFDVNQQKGHYLYTFGEYVYCGIKRVSQNKNLLCIQNDTISNIITLDSSNTTFTDIDKKVLELSKLNEVKKASVSGSIVYITQNVTDTEFNKDLKSYQYKSAAVSEATQAIQAKVTELGIQQAGYSVIYTLKP